MPVRHGSRTCPAPPCRLRRCPLTSIHPCQRRLKSIGSCLSRPHVIAIMSGKVCECVGAIETASEQRFGHGWYIGACGWSPRCRLAGSTAGQDDLRVRRAPYVKCSPLVSTTSLLLTAFTLEAIPQSYVHAQVAIPPKRYKFGEPGLHQPLSFSFWAATWYP